ncbi:MAG: methylmalonyl-CoA mutase family protein [Flavobacteriales bacterium]|nr:methylmalonyl-CoA mutase family protein [Flavobacteriales bacterium]
MENLFKEFEQNPTIEEWNALFKKAVKQPELEDLLSYGIQLDDIKLSPIHKSFKPFSTSQKQSSDWHIIDEFHLSDLASDNDEILKSLNLGSEAIYLNGDIKNADQWKKLTKDINFDYIQTYVRPTSEPSSQEWQFIQHPNNIILNPLNSEPIPASHSFLIYSNQRDTVEETHEILSQYHEALLNQSGSAPIVVEVKVSENYLQDISKLRALRTLMNRIDKAYETSNNFRLIGRLNTARYNTNPQESHDNLLNQTIQVTAAVLGGANGIINSSFDSSNSFESKRLSRNVQLLLKAESFLDKVIDPAKGSYFFEELTRSICDKAWRYFQATETQGGWLARQNQNKTEAI